MWNSSVTSLKREKFSRHKFNYHVQAFITSHLAQGSQVLSISVHCHHHSSISNSCYGVKNWILDAPLGSTLPVYAEMKCFFFYFLFFQKKKFTLPQFSLFCLLFALNKFLLERQYKG